MALIKVASHKRGYGQFKSTLYTNEEELWVLLKSENAKFLTKLDTPLIKGNTFKQIIFRYHFEIDGYLCDKHIQNPERNDFIKASSKIETWQYMYISL